MGSGQVAEWLMAADCKSAAPCELRRFESSPVHQKCKDRGRRDLGLGIAAKMGTDPENGKLDGSGADLDRKFWVAMAMYAVLAVLAWLTMGDGTVLVYGRPVEMRLVPLIVIGGLALRTVLARQAEKIRRSGEKNS